MDQKDNFLIKGTTITDLAASVRKLLKSEKKLTTNEITKALNSFINKDIVFTSSKTDFNITMRGTGEIALYINDKFHARVPLNPEHETQFALHTIEENSIFSMDDAEGLVELDMREAGLESLVFNSYIPLKKLVIFGNDIKRLDLSKCKELQFLHFHNNPICDSDDYKDELVKCIESLPDRSEDVIGSILLYPWYGLETLVCRDNGAWRKYPIEKWVDNDGTERKTYSSKMELTKDTSKLFGEVLEDNTIEYFTWGNNGNRIIHTSMNRHHRLRKELENTLTLKKNWMFGSAIQYEEEYKYCHYYFRDIGVQHVWETAEKGFGIKIGTIDSFDGNNAMNMNEMNVIASLKIDGEDNTKLSHTSDVTHGNFIFSQLAGRGNNIVYGLCPNASVFQIKSSGYNSETWRDSIQRLTSNCNSLTFSYNVGANDDNWARTRILLGNFGKDNIITASAGNGGDNIPWTQESQDTKFYGFGNFGELNKDGQVVEHLKHHSNTFFVPALTPTKKASTFSNSTLNGYRNGISNIPLQDFISSYGEQILGYDSYNNKLDVAQGTSMASPNCNGTLALMRIIYSKINPECFSFGKGSEFMQYVLEHWIDPIEEKMEFSVGVGIPTFCAKPANKNRSLEKGYSGVLVPQVGRVGEEIKIQEITPNGHKRGHTYQLNHNYFAYIGNNTIVPLKQTSEAIAAKAYSNASLSEPENFSENYNKIDILLPKISPSQNSLVLAEGALPVLQGIINDENCFFVDSDKKKYTMQFKVQFSVDKLLGSKQDGEYSGTVMFSKLFYDNFTFYIGISVKANISNGNGKFDQSYTSALGCSGIGTYNGVGVARFDYKDTLELLKNNDSVGVFTITCDGDRLSLYYNGTLLNKIDSGLAGFETLGDWIILSEPLITNSQQDVVFYDRCLSNKEIINNTIVMLNKEV